MRDEQGKWLAGVSPNPSGKPAQKFMTEALQMYLLRPDDLPPPKPRNAAEKIARKMVEKACDGDNDAAKMIYDRMEGKAVATIKAEIETKPMDIMDAARRLAFIINSAAALGEKLPDEYSILLNPMVTDAEVIEVDGKAVIDGVESSK